MQPAEESSVTPDASDPDVGLAAERVRVAHELHDSVIQALVAVTLQLSALERHPPASAELPARLAESQALLRSSIGDLREWITRIKPVSLDAQQLPAAVAEIVERFSREFDVRSQCTCSGTPARVSAQACGQIVRITQEALMNVRRHSGASTALVSLMCEPTVIRLIVDDDGRGFPFEGVWDHDALDRERRGPVVIKERVRLLSGTLTIRSTPGSGSRLEISIPCAP